MKIGKYLSEGSKKYTIMDMGSKYPMKIGIEMTNPDGSTTNEISRFGVWIMSGTTAKKVIDMGNNLKKLQKKYDVPDDMVFRVGKGK